MSTPRDPRPPGDLDPTGIRALLASLPDPGPMPEDVADRIRASLVAERTATAGSIDELAARRPRRTTRHVLAVAAAVAAVAVVGGGIAAQLGGDRSAWDTVAALSGGLGEDDSPGAGGGQAEADRAAEAGEGAPEGTGSETQGLDDGSESEVQGLDDGSDVQGLDDGSGSDVQGLDGGTGSDPRDDVDAVPPSVLDGSGAVSVVHDLPPLTSDTFAVGVTAALDPGTGPATAATAVEPGSARPCLAATGEDPSSGTWLVGEVVLDGAPAVLVARTAPGDAEPRTAWAVGPDCMAGEGVEQPAPVLLGPVALP